MQTKALHRTSAQLGTQVRPISSLEMGHSRLNVAKQPDPTASREPVFSIYADMVAYIVAFAMRPFSVARNRHGMTCRDHPSV